MTSCGCFECICGIMPEANGFVVVNREFASVTPVGMTFGELASMTGGGVQTPGFMGHGRHFISSKIRLCRRWTRKNSLDAKRIKRLCSW